MVGCRDEGRRSAGQAVGRFAARREGLAEGGLEDGGYTLILRGLCGWRGGLRRRRRR